MLLLSPRMTPEEYAFALTDEGFAHWRPVEGRAQFCLEYDGEMTVYQKLEYMGELMQGFYRRFRQAGPATEESPRSTDASSVGR